MARTELVLIQGQPHREVPPLGVPGRRPVGHRPCFLLVYVRSDAMAAAGPNAVAPLPVPVWVATCMFALLINAGLHVEDVTYEAETEYIGVLEGEPNPPIALPSSTSLGDPGRSRRSG